MAAVDSSLSASGNALANTASHSTAQAMSDANCHLDTTSGAGTNAFVDLSSSSSAPVNGDGAAADPSNQDASSASPSGAASVSSQSMSVKSLALSRPVRKRVAPKCLCCPNGVASSAHIAAATAKVNKKRKKPACKGTKKDDKKDDGDDGDRKSDGGDTKKKKVVKKRKIDISSQWVWEYRIDQTVNNKTPGWYRYDSDASKAAETNYLAWQHDAVTTPSTLDLDIGKYRYRVDFNQMKQSNLTHANHTVRDIRRLQVHST